VRRGHDLARIHISAPAASAPIQRLAWKWDGKTRTWSSTSGPTTETPPSHVGSADGELYEDTYSQATDPTAQPHLSSGEEYFGQHGAELQMQGKTPDPDDVRELAVGGSGRKGGAGLHEVIPTNMRGEVAATQNEALVGTQSGMRTSTDYQTFAPKATGTGEVGFHTGMSRNASGTGSTHTRGQAPAHETLREAMRTVKATTDADEVMNTMALAHLASTPTGQDVLGSAYITGATPNLTSIGTIGPVATSGATPDPERLKLARFVHDRRELVKARERGRARERDPGRKRLPSPSPERTPIDDSGGGGEYIHGKNAMSATTPVPKFPGKGWKKVANEAAWITQPQRHPFDVSTAPRIRPTPSTGTPSTAPVTVTSVSNNNNNNVTATATPPTVTTLTPPPPPPPLLPPPLLPMPMVTTATPPATTSTPMVTTLTPPPPPVVATSSMTSGRGSPSPKRRKRTPQGNLV
jgi:hypothetical protein